MSTKKIVKDAVRRTIVNQCSYVDRLIMSETLQSPTQIAQNVSALAELIRESAALGIIAKKDELDFKNSLETSTSEENRFS